MKTDKVIRKILKILDKQDRPYVFTRKIEEKKVSIKVIIGREE